MKKSGFQGEQSVSMPTPEKTTIITLSIVGVCLAVALAVCFAHSQGWLPQNLSPASMAPIGLFSHPVPSIPLGQIRTGARQWVDRGVDMFGDAIHVDNREVQAYTEEEMAIMHERAMREATDYDYETGETVDTGLASDEELWAQWEDRVRSENMLNDAVRLGRNQSRTFEAMNEEIRMLREQEGLSTRGRGGLRRMIDDQPPPPPIISVPPPSVGPMTDDDDESGGVVIAPPEPLASSSRPMQRLGDIESIRPTDELETIGAIRPTDELETIGAPPRPTQELGTIGLSRSAAPGVAPFAALEVI